MIHIKYKFHEIPFSGYVVMAPDGRREGRMDRRKDRRTDMDKPISLSLLWGITMQFLCQRIVRSF